MPAAIKRPGTCRLAMSRAGILKTLFLVLVMGFLALPDRSALCEQQVPPQTTVQRLSAFLSNQIPQPITNAVKSPLRPAADRADDAARKPEQTMAFFGIAPGMQVADLFAGGGYTTELLSLIVGPAGKVYSQNPEFPAKLKKIEERWHERLRDPKLRNIVAVTSSFDNPGLLPVEPDSLDAVLIVLDYHDLAGRHLDRVRINAAVYKALKLGGTYGIIDHSAQPGSGVRDVSVLHRIDENTVIDEVERAGFALVATSDVLSNPGDDRTWRVFLHHGKTDRFMLKFVKPKAPYLVPPRTF